ncbi:TonB-dependent receptor [Aureibaculum marinum]|uniref:TonB-dependent receptor n=1 Tax=Aureibaculum marinum TaxID=2487930 RepID=A0A3N4NMQ6_9FLAO|nr:TonB-dependent receptor [Aureibaculum marinum]RPD93380.1 TonB-dependent receptor [Aureibaculum marinum]
MYKNVLISIVLILLFTSLHGQTTFDIRGKVMESNTDMPLPGASIVLSNISGDIIKGAMTDGFGMFILNTNKQGSYKLEISFIGFESKHIDIELDGTDKNIGTINLQSSTFALETVTIRSSLEEKQRALNTQRNADNIKNVISSDLIGRFPDLNVAEALQRVPGVNIQRDKGEGSTVTLRGTPQHFTSIQINGEQIPSVQQGGSRNEALDLIPADQLEMMEITKSPTPDMDGDAIGGVVNLKTPTARKYDLVLKVETALGYNDISGKINSINKLRIDKRFFKTNNVTMGKLGIILGGSYYENNNSEDRIDATWTGLPEPITNTGEGSLVMENYQYRTTQNKRIRTGFTGTFDYQFNDKNSIVFKYMYNKRDDKDVRNRLRFDMDRSGSVYETLDSVSEGRIRRDINIWDELKENHNFHLEGDHSIALWNINWSGFYSTSKRTFYSDRGDFANDEIDIVADNPNGIFTDVPNFRQAYGEQSMYDPFFYSDFRRYEEDYETSDADNMVAKIDIKRDIQFFKKHNGYIKFGGKYRSQGNSKYRNNNVYSFNDPNNLIKTEEAFLNVLSGKEPETYLYSDYRFGPLIGRNTFKNYIQDNRRLLTTSDDAWDAKRLSLNDTYDAGEEIIGAYVMGKIQFNKLMVLAGVRYEKNKVDYDAFEVFRVGTDVSGSPISGGNDYDFILPNLQLKYSFDEYTAIRFSSLFNYSRPNYVDIVPFVNFDSDAITLRLGNPNLLPANAFNLDFMVERYFSNIGVISLGAFYKNINDFQFTRIDPSLSEDFPGYPSTQGFKFEQEQNGENAKVAGVELNFVRQLDFLPSFLKNLSIDGNYTYTFSDAFTQDRDGISLPGQANHTFNTALAGDFGNFTARVSANYNGTFINSLASQAQDDIYQLARLQIDANASYKIGKHFRIFTEFTNLTNEPSIRYQGERNRISRIAYFGWLARVGISYRL